MIRKVYSIFDAASSAYGPTFMCITNGEALRAFTDCANSKSHHIGQHPGDYTLFCIALWDDSTGKHSTYEAFENLGNALEYVRPEKQAQLLQDEGLPTLKSVK